MRKTNRDYDIDGQLYINMEIKNNEVFFYPDEEDTEETMNITVTKKDFNIIKNAVNSKYAEIVHIKLARKKLFNQFKEQYTNKMNELENLINQFESAISKPP